MTPKSRFPAVIFDMDGLLVDSEPLWAISETEMLEARGKTFTPEINIRYIGMRPKDFIAGLCEGYGLTEPVDLLLDLVQKRMIELIHERVEPRPGALELLAWLNAQGIPCAIASSSPVQIIDAVVETMGWRDTFVEFTSGDHVMHGKPAPDIYLEAARRMGVDPALCLALEDSPTGARAAVAAGMTTYAVPDPSHASPALFASVTPHVFHSLHEVLADLQR